jgi:hypothetical protein
MSDTDDENDPARAPDSNVVRVDFSARARKTTPQPHMVVEVKPAADEPEKLQTFRRLIARFHNTLELSLNFSHRFGIPDFNYDVDGVRASLSFQGHPMLCDVPWSAVYGMRSEVSREVQAWPADLPPELAERLPPQLQRPNKPGGKSEDKTTPERRLRVVAPAPEPDDTDGDA